MLEVLNVPDDVQGRQSPTGDDDAHLIFMLRTVMSWDNTDKAQRWIGWAQCLACMLGLMTLEQCKSINKEA